MGETGRTYPENRPTLIMETTMKRTERAMVNWKRVFSRPRRVRTVDWALPNKPAAAFLDLAEDNQHQDYGHQYLGNVQVNQNSSSFKRRGNYRVMARHRHFSLPIGSSQNRGGMPNKSAINRPWLLPGLPGPVAELTPALPDPGSASSPDPPGTGRPFPCRS